MGRWSKEKKMFLQWEQDKQRLELGLWMVFVKERVKGESQVSEADSLQCCVFAVRGALWVVCKMVVVNEIE